MVQKYIQVIQVHTNTKSIVLTLGLLLRAAGQQLLSFRGEGDRQLCIFSPWGLCGLMRGVTSDLSGMAEPEVGEGMEPAVDAF